MEQEHARRRAWLSTRVRLRSEDGLSRHGGVARPGHAGCTHSAHPAHAQPSGGHGEGEGPEGRVDVHGVVLLVVVGHACMLEVLLIPAIGIG